MTEAAETTGEGAGALRRAARVGRTIVALHVEVAAKEAARDRKRIGGGVALLLVGAALAFFLLVMLHVAGAAFLRERFALPWALSALAVAGADLLLASVFLLGARSRLRGPLMPETRTTLRRTVDALLD